MKRKREKTLKAIRPNAGIRAAYQRRIDAMIQQMQASYLYFLKAQYRATPPVMAQDMSPAMELKRALRKLGKRWEKNFEEGSGKLAAYFAKDVSKRSDAALRKILKDAGFSVEFKMTRAMRDVLNATVAENVSLIKSIQSDYHTQVEGLVMRSVTAGRDLSDLTDELQERYGITRRRAAFISLDQNNKSTAALQRVRQLEVGLEDGLWLHSLGGVTARRTHLANNQKKFSIRDGWFDPDPKVRKRIWPGELPRCRCVWRPIVKGFS